MYGSFNEDAQGILDFTRCQRPNGTFYGPAGKCKSGDEVGAREMPTAKPKKAAAKKKPKVTKAKAKAALKAATPEQLEKLKSHPKVTPEQKKTLDKAIAEKKSKKSSGKPAQKTDEDRIKELKAEAEKLKAAFAKHQEKGEWEKADAAISKATAINKELDKLTQTSKKSQEKTKQAQNEEKEVVDRLRKDVATAGKRQEEYDKRQDETNLSPKQRAAIRSYTDEPSSGTFGYRQLNECSRTPPFCEDPKQAKQLQKDLDDTLKALPKNDNGDPFFRGVFVGGGGGPTAKLYEALENAQPGQRFKDPAFGSFSSDFTTAGDFAGSGRSIVFVSRSKQLTPVNRFSTMSDENEALLPRGTEQTIRSVTKLKDQLIVELD